MTVAATRGDCEQWTNLLVEMEKNDSMTPNYNEQSFALCACLIFCGYVCDFQWFTIDQWTSEQVSSKFQ